MRGPSFRILFRSWVLLLALVPGVRAQAVTDSAGWVTPLGALGASARANALGDAMAGLADDPSALFFNSAGLGRLSRATLSINHNSYLAGTFEETLLFGMPAAPLGGWGVALQYVGWGFLDKRDINGVPQGSFSDSDVGLSLGWGREVAGPFSLGLAIHVTQQKVVDELYTSISGDLGVLYAPSRDFRAGLSLTGLGIPLKGFGMARDLHGGISARFDLDPSFSFVPLLAGYWEPEGVSRIQGGLEGDLEKRYFLRVGGQVVLADNRIGGLTGFTAGAGLRLGAVTLDYAFVPYGDLGTSHRVSLGYDFPDRPPPPAKPVTAPPVTILATPVPTPTASGPLKAKVEVHFELPGSGDTPGRVPGDSALLRTYEAAVQKDPNDSRAWRNLGVAYLKDGKTALGLQSLEQALRLNPGDQPLRKWLEDYHARHPGRP